MRLQARRWAPAQVQARGEEGYKGGSGAKRPVGDHIPEVWVWEVCSLEIARKMGMPFPEHSKKGWT